MPISNFFVNKFFGDSSRQTSLGKILLPEKNDFHSVKNTPLRCREG
jgi:hypothetical protein